MAVVIVMVGTAPERMSAAAVAADSLTGNNHRVEGSVQPPRAVWPSGQGLACGDTVSAGDSSGSDG
jgi:hypothetical protein